MHLSNFIVDANLLQDETKGEGIILDALLRRVVIDYRPH